MQVTLIKPHTHANTDYPTGTTLDLPAGDAAWVLANGVAGECMSWAEVDQRAAATADAEAPAA